MPSDELILSKVLHALREVKLEAILVGNAACALQGVPIMTQDIDFFIRDTKLNREKINRFAKLLNLNILKPDEAISETIRTENNAIVVDFVFRLGPKQTFESVRSRSKLIKIGDVFCRVASLKDILKAKSSAARLKDKAVIEIIRNTIKVKNHLEQIKIYRKYNSKKTNNANTEIPN